MGTRYEFPTQSLNLLVFAHPTTVAITEWVSTRRLDIARQAGRPTSQGHIDETGRSCL